MATRLSLPDLETARPALAAEYAAALARGGSVMAILRAMGPRVDVLRAFVDLADAALYGPAALGRRDRALATFATRLTLAPREGAEAVAALREHLTDDEVHDAIAVVGLLNLANRTALATGITEADDLR